MYSILRVVPVYAYMCGRGVRDLGDYLLTLQCFLPAKPEQPAAGHTATARMDPKEALSVSHLYHRSHHCYLYHYWGDH